MVESKEVGFPLPLSARSNLPYAFPILWEKEAIAFKPIHYLELLERKPGALDHAKPLA